MRHRICSVWIRSVFVTGALALGSLLAIAPMAVAADASMSHCVAPAGLTRLDQPLRRTARRLASHKLIMIVALGSSSTAGAGAGSAETTYPSRLMVELAQRLQTQPIVVLNRGISGERAIDMLARFDESVSAERPDLVLWQVGTNAVLRGYEHSKSIFLIRDGIRRMKAIGADVVLIDPQFAPKVIAKPEIEDMVDLIRAPPRKRTSTCFTALLSCGTGTTSMACHSRHSFHRTGCI